MVGIAAFAIYSRHRAAAEIPLNGDDLHSLSVRLNATLPAPDPRLDQILDTVDFDQAKLSDVLQWLSQKGNLNVVLDWAAMERKGVSANQSVTVHLKHVQVRQALDAALQGGAEERDRQLGWAERNGIITISTRPKIDIDYKVTRIYNVLPLLQDWVRVQHQLQSASTSPSGVTNANMYEASLEELTDKLKKHVVDNVEPESWLDNGGDIGSIDYWAGKLIITQSERAQDQIARLLATMRRSDPPGRSR
jgi:hypothetical protein